ncbi:Acyl-CoA N-acyltransferases (Nat) [Venustampulla echinocandica]|uniref:Acyl-CoA N-acyltransferases (Nat) n=1 Tax=Venustampulla echinocandica TaxID=2656787 RepID=A0A370U2I6_9HELO|nr:Acyl-CoA N-acyltransferases (Nat) [Venustampulla echinocandica]RDL41989.1 Acyl-CoA N-acyltransferases (Nat) [Venustampulla echinocandica]
MFGSTYEREAAFTDDMWYGRLANPQATTFITLQADCVVGTLTVVGPLPFRPDESPPATYPKNSLAGEEPRYWHSRIDGIFTAPEVRGRGVAKALIEKGIKFGLDEAAKSDKEYVASIVVDSDNAAAKGLYEKYGYVTIKEEPRSPGSARTVLLMEYSLNP